MIAVLVTGAGGPLGVNATRSLRRAPHALRLIGTDANRWHLPLSECDRTYRIPLAREGDRYRAALDEIVRREDVSVIVPTHPVEVRAVAALRDAGQLPCAVALPRTAVLETCDDKARTQALLAAAGVAVPRTIALDGPDDVARAFAVLRTDAGTPVWIRGSGAPGLGIGGAALPCREPGVARAWVEHHRGWGKMSASEYLPGDNLSWMALFQGGALIAAGARQRLEYVLPHVAPSGVTGAPAVSKTVAAPAVHELGARAVRAVDDAPHGVYFVDLKGDEAGEARVTEINAGRCGTTVLAYTEAGYNFPWQLVRIASGEAVEPVRPPAAAVEPEVYWLRTLDCGPAVVRGDAGFDDYPTAGLDEQA